MEHDHATAPKPRGRSKRTGCALVILAVLGTPCLLLGTQELQDQMQVRRECLRGGDICKALAQQAYTLEPASWASVRRATQLWTWSCEGGVADSCHNAGVANELEIMGPDLALAIRFYRRACELGEQKSCRRLRDLGAE